jgi:hypothetical protein
LIPREIASTGNKSPSAGQIDLRWINRRTVDTLLYKMLQRNLMSEPILIVFLLIMI